MVIILAVFSVIMILVNLYFVALVRAHIYAKDELIAMFTDLLMDKGIKYEELEEFIKKHKERNGKKAGDK